MNTPLDTALCQELRSHVEILTHSGLKCLDPEILKKVKRICKLHNGYVEHTYHLLLHQLETQHSEVRFSSFQIMDELFRRSHHFREILISNLQHVIELTTETSTKHLLPPPKAAAKRLKEFVLKSIHEWNKEYGEGYKMLTVGYNFLKNCKKIDFTILEIQNSAEQRRLQERNKRLEVLSQEKVKKMLAEYNDNYLEIKDSVAQMENCIALLIPSLEEFFISEGNTESSDHIHTEVAEWFPSNNLENKDGESTTMVEIDEEEGGHAAKIREHGMLNPNYSVQVNVKPVEKIRETSGNTVIFENCRDLYRLIENRHLPSVKKWVQIATKHSASSDDIKKLIHLKETLEKVLKKCSQLELNSELKNDSDSSDAEFEEVPEKDGYEESVKQDFVALPVLSEPRNKPKLPENDWNILSKENNEEDPTTLLSSLVTGKLVDTSIKAGASGISNTASSSRTEIPAQNEETEKIMQVPSTSNDFPENLTRKEKLLKVAPKLPFDVDLYHWEDENMKAPTMLMAKPDGARFWSATSVDELEEVAVPDGIASLRTRVIEFTGKHEPVKWTCRAPLPSGKLCPRRDKQKCPFHGVIVPRDNTGKCSNPEDEIRLKEEAEKQQQMVPDWQDPKLLEEIKEATGLDLKIPEKGKKRKKKLEESKKFPGLTDIKAKQNNSYTRLAKKIFKKSTMKKVASQLDAADHRRFRDKFGDQFNYVHETV